MGKAVVLLFLFFCGYFASAQDSTLQEYKGVYIFKEGSPAPSVEISIRDGALYATSTIGSASLSRVSQDTFSIPDHNGAAYFYRTEGKVKSIRIEVADMILEGDKDAASVAVARRKRHVLRK